MGTRIPESLKAEVVWKWLGGHSRNKVAAICGISQAATSGIIDEWKRSEGVTRAEQLRDLATTMDRHGISVVQCAQGFRIARLLSNLGVDEDDAESFLVETYNGSIGIGIGPQDISSHLRDLISFAVDAKNLRIGAAEEGLGGVGDSDDLNGVPETVPSILQIAKYLEKAKEENKKAEQKNKELKKEMELREAKKSSIMKETEAILRKHHMTAEKLDWYLELKTVLLVSGHSENDIELLMKGIELVKEEGCDLLAIAAEFSEHAKLQSSIRRLQVQKSMLERNNRQLEEKIKISEQTLESKSQLQWNMVKLEGMGFGLKQLSWLYNFVKEFSEANGLSEADGYAVKIFMDQVERYYDYLFGFAKQADKFKEELQKLNIQYLAQVNVMSALPYVGSALAHLLNSGIKVDQIVKLAELSEMHPDMIQKLLQHCSHDNKEQQQNDDLKSVW